MKVRYLVAALAAAAAATPAMAQTSGGRFEGLVGYDSVEFDLDELGEDSRSGLLYGLGIGYDFAVGVGSSIGVDLEATEAETDLEANDGADNGRVSIGRDLYAGVRFTGAVSPNFNLYGKVGYTNLKAKARLTLGGVTESESGELDGVRGGIGGQFMMGTSTYLGAEYRYSNYEADVSRHQVAAMFGIRF